MGARPAGRSRGVTLRRSDSESPCSRMRVRSFSAKGDPLSSQVETTRRPRWRTGGRPACRGECFSLPCRCLRWRRSGRGHREMRRGRVRRSRSSSAPVPARRRRVIGLLRGPEGPIQGRCRRRVRSGRPGRVSPWVRGPRFRLRFSWPIQADEPVRGRVRWSGDHDASSRGAHGVG